MKDKLNNIILIIIVSIIIVISFKWPEMLLLIQEKTLENNIYKKVGSEQKIDVEAENIYLVKVIHLINNSECTEVNLSNEYEKQDFSKKLYDLEKKYGILKNHNLKDKSFNVTRSQYSTENVNIDSYVSNDNLNIIEIEVNTDKIINMTLEKNFINDSKNYEEILKKYIEYLQLDILDDWEYKADIQNRIYIFKSEKAQLAAVLYDDNIYWGLGIIESDDITYNETRNISEEKIFEEDG